jgi:2',3'-cyclic-nucleotide 2'-phosphodiesterase (5'-nucleotidase family)
VRREESPRSGFVQCFLPSLPFLNDSVTLDLEGGALKAVLEQGFSLEAGMAQVSGLKALYDLSRAVGARLISLEIGGQAVDDHRRYRVTTNSFLAEGGDGYAAFRQGRIVARDPVLSEVVTDHIRQVQVVEPPAPGRLIPV